MQRRVNRPVRLLNERGELNVRGYSTAPILDYQREDIKACPWRIKEWDYYLVHNEDFAIALTVADNSYMGFLSVSFIDFKNRWYKTSSVIKPFTFGKIKLPRSSVEGNVLYKDERIHMEFLHEGKSRHLKGSMKKWTKHEDFECDLHLSDEPRDSMVIAIGFPKKKRAFYYNQKINGFTAQGKVVIGGREYLFHPKNSFGTLDWGRGVWPYKNIWYWGSASGKVSGKRFGFNIGYGFGDTSDATENMLFCEGVAHKLDQVTFHIPREGNSFAYLKPWSFSSNDGRFEMAFVPIIDRMDATSIGIISSNQHQVFGRFSGKAVLDSGEVINVKDMLGFAERVENRW